MIIIFVISLKENDKAQIFDRKFIRGRRNR